MCSSAADSQKIRRISPKLAFDVAHEVYSALRADLEGIAPIDLEKVPSDRVWRPQSGPRGEEYVADFALAGKAALQGFGKTHLLITFNLYYLSLTPFENLQGMREFLHIREDVIALWLDEIKERVGREIIRRGIFPPKKYFAERSRPRHVKPHEAIYLRRAIRSAHDTRAL